MGVTGSLLIGGVAGLHRVWPGEVPVGNAHPRLVLTALTLLNGNADLNRPLPPAVRQQSYLIGKEAVTNALRHAPPAAPLTLTLRYDPALLEIRVQNDGPIGGAANAKPASRAGQGLRNMRHRAELMNAGLTIGPRAEGGWEVALRVPL